MLTPKNPKVMAKIVRIDKFGSEFFETEFLAVVVSAGMSVSRVLLSTICSPPQVKKYCRTFVATGFMNDTNILHKRLQYL
jgi:hypothetical protein